MTFGSNIPLFTLARDEPHIKCFQFPAAHLSDEVRAQTKWLNFYDADDVLGYPLKPISPDYAARVTEDIEINVGGLFTSWNPISHTQYWSDEDFIDPVVKLIRAITNVA